MHKRGERMEDSINHVLGMLRRRATPAAAGKTSLAG
jgi:hypothetical protein